MRFGLLSIITLICLPFGAIAEDLDISGYQDKDGAITNGYKGDTVDPYFATKALLTAQDAGLKIQKPAKAWVKWAIHAQRNDGLFERYKRDNQGYWHIYAPADADDAISAMWVELLYRLAPDSGLPEAWKKSVDSAEEQLAALYDDELGIYHISEKLSVGLLMDNVEVYAAFKSIALQQKRFGNEKEAKVYNEKAEDLGNNILNVFKQKNSDKFLISTQPRTEVKFYPDKVAQIYPLLYPLQDNLVEQNVYWKWIKSNGKEWMTQRIVDYTWGLVAIASLNMGDNYSALCWQSHAEPMRYSVHWNVLEEVTLQAVKLHMHVTGDDKKIPCVGGEL